MSWTAAYHVGTWRRHLFLFLLECPVHCPTVGDDLEWLLEVISAIVHYSRVKCDAAREL